MQIDNEQALTSLLDVAGVEGSFLVNSTGALTAWNLSSAVGEEVHHAVTFQVDQDGAEPIAAPKREIVDPQKDHRPQRGIWQRHYPDSCVPAGVSQEGDLRE